MTGVLHFCRSTILNTMNGFKDSCIFRHIAGDMFKDSCILRHIAGDMFVN